MTRYEILRASSAWHFLCKGFFFLQGPNLMLIHAVIETKIESFPIMFSVRVMIVKRK